MFLNAWDASLCLFFIEVFTVRSSSVAGFVALGGEEMGSD